MIGLRSAIARQVRGMLSDPANPPIQIAEDGSGLFPPDSIAWRVHRDVTGMMVGGIAALMLQMLHPKVLAGGLGPFRFPRGHARPPARHRAVHRRHHL